MDQYKHYIRINEYRNIIYGFSSAFENPIKGDILIYETENRHFGMLLYNENNQCIYEWQEESFIKRSETELTAELISRQIEKTNIQRLYELEQIVADVVEIQLGGIING